MTILYIYTIVQQSRFYQSTLNNAIIKTNLTIQSKHMKHAEKKNENLHLQHRLREVFLITIIALAAFLLLSFITYSPHDPAWSVASSTTHITNAGGRAGAWFADIFLCAFGYPAYIFPFLLAFGAWSLFCLRFNDREFSYSSLALRALGFILVLSAASGLVNLHFPHIQGIPYSSGGIWGTVMGQGLAHLLNPAGTTLILITLLLCGITLSSGVSWLAVLESLGLFLLTLYAFLRTAAFRFWDKSKEKFVQAAEQKALKKAEDALKIEEPQIALEPFIERAEPITAPQRQERVEPVFAAITPPVPSPVQQSTPSTLKVIEARPAKPLATTSFKVSSDSGIPDLNLLEDPEVRQHQGYTHADLTQMSAQVESKLLEFGVEAHVVEVVAGPVVTRFELKLAPGMKVSKLVGLSKDIARSLAVISVRIVEVIPGKPHVGLEIPNAHREMVRLKEVLAVPVYQDAHSPLSLALGKDIAGHPIVVDVAKMPHLLVAGTTGSGKSVCLNAMLLSFLYKATPKDLRLILVDPKMLELSIYEGIPHLLTPVVTDMKEAANALRWCVAEMDRRYRLMAALGVRNLAGFNKKLEDAAEKGSPILDPFWQEAMGGERPSLEHLPFIVVLIDEFADMMMVVGKKVEELIARIAQKARAAGIHLILATQRPSVDVITGLIKANIPTRIAFQVSARVDSRTILDQQGAENLLGHGDMLYLAPGTGVPIRVHGAFVSDQEVHNVVNDLKSRGEPEYLTEILEGPAEKTNGSGFDMGMDDGDAESDPLYDQAVYIVTESRRASISNIQRRLKIGYNRAARLIEDMEKAGIVTPMEQNGNRDVLAPPPPKDD